MKYLITIIVLMSALNVFATNLKDVDYEERYLAEAKPLKSEDIKLTIYKALKKRVKEDYKDSSRYTPVIFEEVKPEIQAWLMNDDGNKVMGMQVDVMINARSETAEEVLHCIYDLLHEKLDIFESGSYKIVYTDCVTDI